MSEGSSPDDTEKAYRRWLKASYRKDPSRAEGEHRTDSGIDLRPVYGPPESEAEDSEHRLGSHTPDQRHGAEHGAGQGHKSASGT